MPANHFKYPYTIFPTRLICQRDQSSFYSNVFVCILAGISGKSQFLLALVFTTRYVDLFTHFVSPYNTLMKIFFLILAWTTVSLIYGKFKATYLSMTDTFRVEFLIVPCGGLACLVNHDYSPVEVSPFILIQTHIFYIIISCQQAARS